MAKMNKIKFLSQVRAPNLRNLTTNDDYWGIIKALNSIHSSNFLAINQGTKEIAESEYANKTAYKIIAIPDGVTTIGANAFKNCSGLVSMHMPESITTIGDYAFSGCSGLARISIPSNIQSIGANAFSGLSISFYTSLPANKLSGYPWGANSDYSSIHYNCCDGTECTANRCTVKNEVHTHKEVTNETAATCTLDGTRVISCSECGATLSEETIAAKGHNYGTLVPATEAVHTSTTLEPSVAAHYQCSVCNKYFNEAKVATTLAALTGKTPTHTYSTTWSTSADKHWKECTCGSISDEGTHADNNSDNKCDVCGATINAHTCTASESLGKAATCTESGLNDHYQCASCGKYYEDQECTKPIDNIDTWKTTTGKIAAKGHTPGTWTNKDSTQHTTKCTVCYDSLTENHTLVNGKCSCGYEEVTHTHIGELQTGKAATCTEDGWKDYYQCSCDKYYTEAACNNEITDLEAWKADAGKIPASHIYVENERKPAIHEKGKELVNGTMAHYTCQGCDKLFIKESGKYTEVTADKLIIKAEHDFSQLATNAEYHWYQCSCGEIASQAPHTDNDTNGLCDVCGITINSGGGTETCTHQEDKLSYSYTYDKDSYDGYHTVTVTCTVCNTTISSSTELCTIERSHDHENCKHLESCKLCGYTATIDNALTIIDSDPAEHWYECTVTGCKYQSEHETHEESNWIYDADGYHIKTCTACGYEIESEQCAPYLYYGKNENHHWYSCSRCNYTGQNIEHSYDAKYDNTYHWEECTCGKTINKTEHEFVFTPDDTTSGYGHYGVCSCGKNTTREKHTPGDEATCTAPQTCTECGYEIVAAKGHLITELSPNADGSTHELICSICGSIGSEDCYVYEKATCESAATCECGRTIGEPLGHSYTTYTYNNDATCGKAGTKTATCDNGCGESRTIVDYDHPATGDHVWNTGKVTTEASCTEQEVTTYECTVCDATKTEITGGYSHGSTYTSPNNNGTHDIICSTCNKTIDSSDCTVSTAATCTNAATCVCGYVLSAPLAHEYGTYTSNNDATCTEDGTKTATCKNCPQENTVRDVGSATGHSPEDYWSYDTEVHYHKCSVCGEATDTREGHSTEWTTDTEPTCNSKGSKHEYCSICGWTSTPEDIDIDPDAHSFTTYKSNNDATCTKNGTKTATCDYGCGTTDTIEIENSKTAHSYAYTYEDDSGHWQECSCGDTVNPSDHSFSKDGWVETEAATCTTAGSKYNTCICGYTITESIPAGHNYDVNGYCTGCGLLDPAKCSHDRTEIRNDTEIWCSDCGIFLQDT